MRPERVLLLGAGGAIGATCASAIAEKGFNVVGTLRPGGEQGRLPILNQVELIECDVLSRDQISELVANTRPDAVVIACLPANGEHLNKRSQFDVALHSLMTFQSGLWQALENTGFEGRVVHMGSGTAYGDAKTTTGLPSPKNYRGVLKAMESLFVHQQASCLGVDVLEMRIFSAYGPWMRRSRLISRLMHAAVSNERIQLTRQPIYRDMIYQSDIARACVLALEAERPMLGLVNLGSGALTSIRTIAELVSSLAGRPLFELGGDNEADPLAYSPVSPADAAGAFANLGPLTSLEQGLKDMLEWANTNEGKAFISAPAVDGY